MTKTKLPIPKRSLITELAFNLVLDSEETEGYQFNIYTVDSKGASRMLNINKDVVLQFLQDEYTKVSVKVDENTFSTYLIASNLISNETIKISGLSDHYLALLRMVDRASTVQKMYKANKDTPILTHQFIKDLNLALQSRKYGEIGIGEYRHLDFLGKPVEMCVTTTLDDIKQPILSVRLTSAEDVQNEMNKLVEWTNTVAFKNGRDVMKDITEFHARFIKIHPFRDGNGRTARLVTNFLCLVLGQPIISIPIQAKEKYVQALNYANTTSVELSAKDIRYFKEFLFEKYHELNPNSENATEEEMIKFMSEYRNEENKYEFLEQSLKANQLQLSSKKVIANILNDYGQKNLNFHFNVGSITTDQIDYQLI